MQPLPIETVLPQLLNGLNTHSQIILQAAPGAGKSTFFPLELVKQKVIEGKIIMLEPRRLAAKSIATFIAHKMGQKVGEEVGYRIKGESKVSKETRLEIVTEGVLTRMIQSDPELSNVGLIIFDEFHERSLHADLALALTLDVQSALRDDLKIVVMSATLEMSSLVNLLPDALEVNCEGRTYPIDIRYSPLKPNDDFISKIVAQITSLYQQEQGSILVFLPGVSAIKRVEEQLLSRWDNGQAPLVTALYGQLDFSKQQQAIAPVEKDQRKIVLATNVAETSLTIEGIRIVVDSGLERQARFDPVSGVTRLEEIKIAQSSAQQRAGRAGRVEPGICVRVYSESQYSQQPKVPQADMLQSDLTNLALELANWGVQNVSELSWLDLPPQPLVDQARALLQRLELMDPQYQLTSMGKEAYQLGIDPRLASMLIRVKSQSLSIQNTAIVAAALVEEPERQCIDLSMALHLWMSNKHSKQRHINQRISQLASILGVDFSKERVDESELGRCLAFAFPDRIAQRRGQRDSQQFKLSNGHGATVREAHLFTQSDYLVVCDLMRFQSASSQIKQAVAIQLNDFSQALLPLTQEEDYVDWDDRKGQLIAEKRVVCGDLVIRATPSRSPDREKMTQALLNYVRRKGLGVLEFSEETLAWLERVRCAALWMDDKPWPNFDDSSLLDSIEQWLEPYMNNVTSLKHLVKLRHVDALKAYLGWPLNDELDRWLPVSWTLPTGSKKKIRYRAGHEPMLSVRIQEVFGEKDSPLIAQGKKKLVLELLSPAQRPIQVTQDLAAFWLGSYKEVQKEMKGRYPKHVWPDDPATHVATTKTKRHFNS